MQLIDQPIRTIIQAHSMQIVALGTFAEIALDYLEIDLPWWGHLTLLVLAGFGRVVKQPSISGGKDATDEPPLGI